MKKIIFKITARLSFCIWAFLGLIVIGSIVNNILLYLINLIMGIIFLAFAYFLFLKSKNSIKIILKMGKKLENDKEFKQLIRLDFVIYFISTIIGSILFFASIGRVFFEKFPIFG